MAVSAPTHPAAPDFSLEHNVLNHADDLFAAACRTVIGIDEAGRGPWAGPVTAAAVWINPDALDQLPQGLNDSKKMSAQSRAHLFALLSALPSDVFCAQVVSLSAAVIDADGILPATFQAMDDAASRLISAMDSLHSDTAQTGLTVLVDGNLAPPFPSLSRHPLAHLTVKPIVKGDARSLSIAAASIMAKETRDALMTALDQDHPGYGWASNKGYGTADHSAALAKQGPTQHHRLSYKPVAQLADAMGYTR